MPEIAIINTNRRVKVSGKIDRADIFNNRLRIIDYKTSKYSADFKLLNFYLGKKFTNKIDLMKEEKSLLFL